MKKLLCIIALSFSFNLFGNSILFDKYYESFVQNVEENLVWRHSAIDFLKVAMSTKVLKSSDLKKIHQGTDHYKKIRDNFYYYIDNKLWVAADNTEYVLDYTKPSKLIKKKRKFYKRIFKKKYKTIIRINPNDTKGQVFIKQVKLSLAASLILFDNYNIIFTTLTRSKKLRRIVNQDNEEIDGLLEDVTKSYNSRSKNSKAKRLLKTFKALREYEEVNPLGISTQDQYLNQLIENSINYNRILNLSRFDITKQKYKFYKRLLKDEIYESKTEMTNDISKVFGNTVGMVQSRSGKMKSFSKEKLQRLAAKLKPLDILFEKTPFRLTDKFIPGHWGHVAIWTGTKKELQNLGLWDHELIKPFQKEIEFDNKRIIEALRPGVQINTLAHFMDIDDFAAIRHKDLTEGNKVKYLLNAFAQIGKKYDFNFNVETDKKIVCSELAFVTFDDMKWPTDKQLGRHTISPDRVAEKAGYNKEFTPVVIYHDGIELKNNLEDNFQFLLEKEYSKIIH